jgi:hypothetical protein
VQFSERGDQDQSDASGDWDQRSRRSDCDTTGFKLSVRWVQITFQPLGINHHFFGVIVLAELAEFLYFDEKNFKEIEVLR